MRIISSSDVIKKPSAVTNPQELTIVKDLKKNLIKSVVLPYALYEKIKDKLEDELYLMENADALGKEAYAEFLQIEEAAEDLAK